MSTITIDLAGLLAQAAQYDQQADALERQALSLRSRAEGLRESAQTLQDQIRAQQAPAAPAPAGPRQRRRPAAEE